jgi:heat shock protein HtpX
MSTLRLSFLILAMTALFLFVGGLLGGSSGMVIALVFALIFNVGMYWNSDKLVLKMTRAQAISPKDAPELYRMTERLADRAGIPMPRLYIIPDPQPNAFATGRNPEKGVVAVNQGLLNMMNSAEVEGVIAHEIAHIKNRDTLIMALVAAMASAIMTLINMAQWAMIFGGMRGDDDEGPGIGGFLLASLLAPIAATIIQMSVSRSREFEADATAAQLVGSPQGLIRALQKLEQGAAAIPSTTASPQMTHMQIVNGLSGQRKFSGFARLFMTHPPTSERIAHLNQFA